MSASSSKHAAAAKATTHSDEAEDPSADLAMAKRIAHMDSTVTMRMIVAERSPELALSLAPSADLPLLRKGLFTRQQMEQAAGRYLRLGAKEGRWREAWQQVAPDATYVFSDGAGDVAVGDTAITTRLDSQLKFLPGADYSDVKWIRYYENAFEFYILNKLRPKGSTRVYTIANYSAVWASHVDPRTGLIMFNAFRDMYDKTQFFQHTILPYLWEDWKGGGHAAQAFVAAGGHELLNSLKLDIPDWLHGLTGHAHTA